MPYSSSQQTVQRVQKSCHFTVLLLTLAILVLIALNGLCFHVLLTSPKDNCGEFHGYIMIGFLMFYILYWVDCWKSASNQYLKNDMSIHRYEDYINDLKRAPPQIGTKIECFRYLRPRGGIEYETDDQGRQRNRPKESDGKVVSFTGTNYFNYSSWKDETGDVDGVIGKGLIKLEIEKVYSFGDEETARLFEIHQGEYCKKYRNNDQYWEETTVLDIPGHLSHVLVRNQGCFSPCCLGVGWFYFFSFFLLNWPYRIWFEFVAKPKKITIHKVIYAQQDEEKTL